MATEISKSLRRGLVIQGGGAKGAFALGCMTALREHGMEFSAVAGTSAGALCAIIWSTGRLDDGVKIWKAIDHTGFFGRNPEGCFRRLIKMLCIAGKLFASYVKNVDPEGRPHFGRDIFFSLVVGVFAWLLLFGILPLWAWLPAFICVPLIALFAFTNEVPMIGWDNRVRQAIFDALVFVATTRLFVSVTWLLLHSAGIVSMETNITWSEALGSGTILAMLQLPIKIQTTLMEGRLLAANIHDFLSSELRIPTYVTVAEESPPNSPHFLLATPGVYKAYYAALHKAPSEVKAAYAYASAALPFGILPHVVIGGKTLVDGGVADNTPVFPMIRENIDEIWIISLQPNAIDIREHTRNVLMQAVFAEGPTMSDDEVRLFTEWVERVRLVILAPRVSLGGLLTGTLNFSERRANACMRHGYRIAKRALRQLNGASGIVLPIYRPRLRPTTRLRLMLRALPPCSLGRLFARSDASTKKVREFHIPSDVRPPPGKEGSAAWFWSVIMVWALFIMDASTTENPWKRVMWGTLIGLMAVVFPTWWARLRRNIGIRT